MTLVVAIIIAVAGLTVGIAIGAWARDLSHVDNHAALVAALRCVHQENGGLSQQTRAIVISALVEHDTRSYR
jgi:hypothetical protein